MPWPKTGATQYHAQLGLPDKGRAFKGLVVCNNLDLEHLDLLNGLALGCYQPSTEVLIVLFPLKLGVSISFIISNCTLKHKHKDTPNITKYKNGCCCVCLSNHMSSIPNKQTTPDFYTESFLPKKLKYRSR